MGDELDLVLRVEELLLGLVELGLQLIVGVFEVIKDAFGHYIRLFFSLCLSRAIVGLDCNWFICDLLFPVFKQFLEFALVLLDDEILLEDGLNQQFFLLSRVLKFCMQLCLLFL